MLARLQAELDQLPSPGDAPALQRLAGDPVLFAWHRAQLTPAARNPTLADFNAASVTANWKADHAAGLDELCRWLEPAEALALVSSPGGLARVLELQQRNG